MPAAQVRRGRRQASSPLPGGQPGGSGTFHAEPAAFGGTGTVTGDGSVTDTFYSLVSDGHIDCQHATYATARSGGGTFIVNASNDGSGFFPFGQAKVGAQPYYVAESFFSFDTSSIPDADIIDSAVLSLNIFLDATATVTSVCEARLHDWDVSLTSAAWVPGASLASKTRLAARSTASGSRFAAGAYTDFVSDAAFVTNINKAGSTRMVVCTHRVAENIIPTNDETVHPYYVEKGTTFRPKLVVVHHA